MHFPSLVCQKLKEQEEEVFKDFGVHANWKLFNPNQTACFMCVPPKNPFCLLSLLLLVHSNMIPLVWEWVHILSRQSFSVAQDTLLKCGLSRHISVHPPQCLLLSFSDHSRHLLIKVWTGLSNCRLKISWFDTCATIFWIRPNLGLIVWLLK